MEQDSLNAADITHRAILEKEAEAEIRKVESEISNHALIRQLAGPPLTEFEMIELDSLYQKMSQHPDEQVRFGFGVANNLITRVYLDNVELKKKVSDFIGIFLRTSILSGKKYRSLGGNRDRLDVLAQRLEQAIKVDG